MSHLTLLDHSKSVWYLSLKVILSQRVARCITAQAWITALSGCECAVCSDFDDFVVEIWLMYMANASQGPAIHFAYYQM